MNFNSKLLLLACLLFLGFTGKAQKYIKPYLGANFSQRTMNSVNSDRGDSLNSADKMKLFPAAGIQFLFEYKPGKEFYIGLGYNEVGFVRERFDYKFSDTVHPDLGKILDLSQGAQKNGFFTYHFRYIEIPIGFNFQITPRQDMHFYTGWVNFGVSPQILLKQQMNIFLEGFTMKGENRFKFDNTGYDAMKINLALQAGGRLDIAIDKKNWVTFDALLKVHVLKTAESVNESFKIWNFAANLGIRHQIGNR